MKEIAIIDYNAGNIRSLGWALERIGLKYKKLSTPDEVDKFSHIILPGVGAFGYGMSELNRLGFSDALKKLVLEGETRLLGICLGMHLLFNSSEESPGVDGLGILTGDISRLDVQYSTLPHIGWNGLMLSSNWPSKLNGIPPGADFYFVHSFGYVGQCEHSHTVTERPGESFVSYIEAGNLTVAQFHPEKSHNMGLKFLHQWAIS